MQKINHLSSHCNENVAVEKIHLHSVRQVREGPHKNKNN